ncbi:MAG TPA: shikimate kinase [Candidatus Limnocylindria bacterium]
MILRPTPGPCRVILLGMMGSGKTTLGTRLAERTGWPYHDNDALVARATGRTARDLALESTQALRDAEAASLRLAMREPEPAIVAAAAGVVLDPALRSELRQAGIVVWLHAPPDVLAERAERGPHRPWLEGDAAAWIAATSVEREPLYAEVADLEVDTDAEPPDRAVDRLVAALEGRGCARWLGTRAVAAEAPS